MLVAQGWADDDLVHGDGGLNSASLANVSGEDGSGDGGSEEPVAHLLGVGFPAALGSKVVVERWVLFVVGEVLALDDFDEFFAGAEEFWAWSQPWFALQNVFGESLDVVQGFVLSSNSFFHDLKGNKYCVK